MHACLRQPMRLCRWAGVFPVEGLDKKSCSELRFNLNSTYTIYHCISLLGQFLLTASSAYHFFTYDLSFNHLKDLVFYTTTMVTAFFIMKLASNWPTLIQRAGYIEKRVTHLIMNCHENNELSLNLLEHYFVSTASFVFELTPYSHWKAILYEVMNIQSTFLWNFTDAMTMCVSLYLTSYFRDLNKLIENQQRLKIIRWEEIRLYYSDLVQLVQTVDSKMCYLILLSFFTNVFFICVQLFSLLKAHKSLPYYFYYCYSSLFLFVRATLTSLLAANVNTVALKPFYILQHVPTSDYTIEVQRFIRQTKYTTTALSGLFFDVTRGMILTVIGTIVKYELVLLQFSVKTYEAIE
ncbi:gustatory receptor for sugar taste 64e-like [Pararge aegeria]|uniref:gustatory receptor for sugar taste 64e-like n=1 Tax=Pararge aegeria TaxID=116150 RepID=UPI0019CFD78C|nr:gustatory receptor for sugar taste 64e-like [Pararge aegeria]